MNMKARYQGALLGLAVGDALGTTLEFKPPGTFESITDIVGGGPFDLEPGQWTDDTSMALCLAESLIEKQGFDGRDQMERYVHWYRHGHLSSNGICFDIGNTVAAALKKFEESGNPYSGETGPSYGGNGSLMRLAPVPMAFSREPETAIQLAGESSKTTHGSEETVDACRYYAGLIIGALDGESKEILLSKRYSPENGKWPESTLSPKIEAVAEGSFKTRQPPEIRGTGYVVRSMEAALWAFHNSDSFGEGALMAVNLGDDADTTGAIYGQLAGAFYGVDAISGDWRKKVAMVAQILKMADDLLELAVRENA